MKALIIEDDRKTRDFIQRGLGENGFTVDQAENGEDGLHLAVTGHYDIIVLDVMMPKKDGWSVLRELRDAGSVAPVIFLTAKDTVDDRIQGLENGADDYLVKPFSFSELLTRIRTVLRRSPALLPETIQVGDLSLSLTRHRAVRGGKLLQLTPKEFALLTLLAQRPGEVVSRAVIADRIWDVNFDTDTNVIDVAVRRLRAKVDEGFPQKLIHTVRGVGYVLEIR
ncbi:DNA-binding response regulator [Burkholderia sp. SRS-46]|nr:DNA-binding response regulator [Burkholderia sp. SRS-46]